MLDIKEKIAAAAADLDLRVLAIATERGIVHFVNPYTQEVWQEQDVGFKISCIKIMPPICE